MNNQRLTVKYWKAQIVSIWKLYILSLFTNKPYLSQDSIASLADYRVYGRRKNRTPSLSKIRKSNSLFILGDRYHEFISKYHLDINAKVLIIGNSDQNFTEPIPVPNSVNLVLCQNSAISDNKLIFTLPIGLENFSLYRSGRKRLYKNVQNQIKDLKVCVPPMSPTNPIRNKVLDQLFELNDENFQIYTDYLPIEQYISEISNFQFLLALEGNGFENHRIWECLYLGIFPVVLETNWSKTLKYLNLPILYIDDVTKITRNLLRNFAEIHKDFDPVKSDALWTPYWENFIKSKF